MLLIIGLGNPGEKYEHTRHNVGFMILDKISQKLDAEFRLESVYDAYFAEVNGYDYKIKLVKPVTFMNDSGRAATKTKNYFKVDGEAIWIIHDDVDLDFGKVRINLGGSSAGHKGVQSIIDSIGENFWRIRVGVGKSDKTPTDKWVLENFTDHKKMEKIVDKVADLVIEFLGKEIKEETISIK